MATLDCTHILLIGEPCYNPTVVNDGQRRFCTTHHWSHMRSDAAYAARAAAYNADPALIEAKNAYTQAVAEARQTAEQAADEEVRRYVPVEIPLETRVSIRLKNIGDVPESNIAEVCGEFGHVQKVQRFVDTATRTVNTSVVTFATHQQAANALTSLDGTAPFGQVIAASWAATHTRAIRQVPGLWVHEHTPAVRAAKMRLAAEVDAARERQEPGIVAAERAEEARITAERAAEEEEEHREMDRYHAADDDHLEWDAAERERAYNNSVRRRRWGPDSDEW